MSQHPLDYCRRGKVGLLKLIEVAAGNPLFGLAIRVGNDPFGQLQGNCISVRQIPYPLLRVPFPAGSPLTCLPKSTSPYSMRRWMIPSSGILRRWLCQGPLATMSSIVSSLDPCYRSYPYRTHTRSLPDCYRSFLAPDWPGNIFPVVFIDFHPDDLHGRFHNAPHAGGSVISKSKLFFKRGRVSESIQARARKADWAWEHTRYIVVLRLSEGSAAQRRFYCVLTITTSGSRLHMLSEQTMARSRDRVYV
jgi:hypothetical protein